MTRRRQWRLVAAVTKKRQHRPSLQERRGLLKWLLLLPIILEKITNIGGWTVKDVYESPTARRPDPPRHYAMDANPGRYEIRGSTEPSPRALYHGDGTRPPIGNALFPGLPPQPAEHRAQAQIQERARERGVEARTIP